MVGGHLRRAALAGLYWDECRQNKSAGRTRPVTSSSQLLRAIIRAQGGGCLRYATAPRPTWARRRPPVRFKVPPGPDDGPPTLCPVRLSSERVHRELQEGSSCARHLRRNIPTYHLSVVVGERPSTWSITHDPRCAATDHISTNNPKQVLLYEALFSAQPARGPSFRSLVPRCIPRSPDKKAFERKRHVNGSNGSVMEYPRPTATLPLSPMVNLLARFLSSAEPRGGDREPCSPATS